MLGLDRVKTALEALGHPDADIPVRVHIGGTNGKGSTAAFVESLVRHSGKRTGLFTSPHLSHFCERFTVAGEIVSPAAVVAAAEQVDQIDSNQLTFFEQVTLIALCLFARARVEVAVLEVGLGGRLDATNAVWADVAAVTGVALDHQTYLGDTLAAIAYEKAGIFKAGQRAVIGRAGEPEAVPLLAAHARNAGVSALTIVAESTPGAEPVEAEAIGLAGLHQRDNAACALAIIDHLEALGAIAADRHIRRVGLASTRLPGRLETIASSPRVVVDGAHNPHAAATLRRAIERFSRPRILLVAVSSSKDLGGILAPLLAGVTSVIAARCRYARTLPATDIVSAVRQIAPTMDCSEASDVPTAIERACALAGPDGTVIAAGSLFLAGEVRQIVCGDPTDPIRVSDPMDIGQSASDPHRST